MLLNSTGSIASAFAHGLIRLHATQACSCYISCVAGMTGACKERWLMVQPNSSVHPANNRHEASATHDQLHDRFAPLGSSHSSLPSHSLHTHTLPFRCTLGIISPHISQHNNTQHLANPYWILSVSSLAFTASAGDTLHQAATRHRRVITRCAHLSHPTLSFSHTQRIANRDIHHSLSTMARERQLPERRNPLIAEEHSPPSMFPHPRRIRAQTTGQQRLMTRSEHSH